MNRELTELAVRCIIYLVIKTNVIFPAENMVQVPSNEVLLEHTIQFSLL